MLEPIAVLCSDIHLSHRPPIARSIEPDWYEAMARSLSELSDLSGNLLPVICGGDLFDRWNSPPELISFAMQSLPECFWSVMGQHDLPNHSYEEKNRSAFWTLVQSGHVNLLAGGWISRVINVSGQNRRWQTESPFGLGVASFCYGDELVAEKDSGLKNVALKMLVAHRYCWMEENGHPGARNEDSAPFLKRRIEGYDVALFGDNHRGFLWEGNRKPAIFNAGTFMRRTSDERDYAPRVGLLNEDGSMKEYFLDTSRDQFADDPVAAEAEKTMLHLEEFLEGLKGLGEGDLDFERAIASALREFGSSKAVRRIVMGAMEEK